MSKIYPDSPGPYSDVGVVTPSDVNALPGGTTRALRANVAGTIKVLTAAGNTVTMNFAAGETRTVQVTQVFATGTTATGIEAMY